MDKKPILILENVSKIYKQRKAVDNISFEVYPGEIVGFLGPNGSGKSTTIKMITGIIKPTSGNIIISNHSLKNNYEKALKNVGSLVESPNLYEYLSGFNNLKALADLENIKYKKERIYTVSNLLGLQNRLKDKVSKYSLGMKQRLGIAQALLSSPKLLILDEPTNGLDANGIHEMRVFLKKLVKEEEVSIFISSHILAEMENLCDRVIIVSQGKIVETRSIEIKENSNNKFIKVNAPNYAGKLIKNSFNLDVKILNNKVIFSSSEELLAKIIVLLTQNKIAIYSAGEIKESLEDIFLEATEKEIR